jgi:DNA-damage-inducible protein J
MEQTANQTTMSFPIDVDLKVKMEQVCQKLGMTTAAAFTMFVNKVSGENRIPFEEEINPFYSEENMAELTRRIADIDSGKARLTEHELIRLDDDDE